MSMVGHMKILSVTICKVTLLLCQPEIIQTILSCLVCVVMDTFTLRMAPEPYMKIDIL